jgi:N-sulfoglucosamine sulfohydrolase
VRSDIADYYFEIEWFDTHLGRMIKTLEEAGELDNTIIIITADNGMPFPRSKTTCYDYGTHMPLAICWGNKIKKGARIDDFISFTDFAPTLLEAAGIDVPEDISGNSFLDIMLANKSGQVDSTRNRVFTALERHTYCRPDGMPYPIRTIRKDDWLYMVNFEPDRWPAGDVDFSSPHQGFYGDIDAGPTREYLIANKDKPLVKYYYDLSVSKHPEVELYNVKSDPFQLSNLASKDEYFDLCNELRAELFAYLKKTNDPRVDGLSPWDNYPYYFKGFDKRHLKPIGDRDNNSR